MSATPPPGLTESDFERIEAAVLETERGRWFLTEYARRIRATETSGLLSALGRIEQTLSVNEQDRAAEAARRFGARLDAVCERLQDLAWRLREAGSGDASAAIEAEAAYLISRESFEPPRALASPRDASDAAEPRLSQEGHGAISLRLQSIGAMDHGPGLDPPAPQLSLPPSLKPVEDPRLEAFAALDGLALTERLAFFA